MARFKKQITIYLKSSWLDRISFFANINEESVSEYAERALNFQLLHDEKAWTKKNQKTGSLLDQLKQLDPTELTDDQLNDLARELAKKWDLKKKIEIAQTPTIKE